MCDTQADLVYADSPEPRPRLGDREGGTVVQRGSKRGGRPPVRLGSYFEDLGKLREDVTRTFPSTILIRMVRRSSSVDGIPVM